MLRYVLYGRWSRGASAKATRWLMLQYEISPLKLAWMTNFDAALEYAMQQRWLVSPTIGWATLTAAGYAAATA